MDKMKTDFFRGEVGHDLRNEGSLNSRVGARFEDVQIEIPARVAVGTISQHQRSNRRGHIVEDERRKSP